MNNIKIILYAYYSNSYPFQDVYHVMKEFYAYYQHTTTSCDSYMESITNLRNFIVNYVGSLGEHPLLVNKKLTTEVVELPNADDSEVDTAKTKSKKAYMSISFMSDINHNRYGQLRNKLHNAFRMVWYAYPKDLVNTYDLAISWKGKTEYMAKPTNDGVDFLTDDRLKDGDVHVIYGLVILTRSGKPV